MTRMTDRPPASAPARARTHLDLVAQQLSAIESFTKARAAAELAERVPGRTREVRMDAERRLEVLRRQHDAVVAHTDTQLRTSGTLLRTTVEPRIVIAHRNEWFAGKLGGVLTERGVHVATTVDNGADAIGIALSEQPELVLVDEKLAMVPGPDVVREISRYCPGSVIAAHVDYSDRVVALLDAGAHAVYTRQMPPGDVAEALLELVGL